MSVSVWTPDDLVRLHDEVARIGEGGRAIIDAIPAADLLVPATGQLGTPILAAETAGAATPAPPSTSAAPASAPPAPAGLATLLASALAASRAAFPDALPTIGVPSVALGLAAGALPSVMLLPVAIAAIYVTVSFWETILVRETGAGPARPSFGLDLYFAPSIHRIAERCRLVPRLAGIVIIAMGVALLVGMLANIWSLLGGGIVLVPVAASWAMLAGVAQVGKDKRGYVEAVLLGWQAGMAHAVAGGIAVLPLLAGLLVLVGGLAGRSVLLFVNIPVAIGVALILVGLLPASSVSVAAYRQAERT